MIYITGDPHGDFRNIARFCKKMQTSKEDVLIILGDAGINYYGSEQDKRKKKYLESLPITIFAIHGNHEMRPQTIPTYHEVDWNGGKVYMEDDYPHILFAKDAELYELNGLFTFVVGGAYNRKETPVLVNGQPITEICISMKDGAQCVNLVSENSDAEAYDVCCAFDEEHNEWLYVISMPEKDKMVLEEICKGYKIKIEDLVRQFYLWVMREPEAAAQWLKGETERKKV